jgi:hypothetical protein
VNIAFISASYTARTVKDLSIMPVLQAATAHAPGRKTALEK